MKSYIYIFAVLMCLTDLVLGVPFQKSSENDFNSPAQTLSETAHRLARQSSQSGLVGESNARAGPSQVHAGNGNVGKRPVNGHQVQRLWDWFTIPIDFKGIGGELNGLIEGGIYMI